MLNGCHERDNSDSIVGGTKHYVQRFLVWKLFRKNGVQLQPSELQIPLVPSFCVSVSLRIFYKYSYLIVCSKYDAIV